MYETVVRAGTLGDTGYVMASARQIKTTAAATTATK
jgi:hypothetical protein